MDEEDDRIFCFNSILVGGGSVVFKKLCFNYLVIILLGDDVIMLC